MHLLFNIFCCNRTSFYRTQQAIYEEARQHRKQGTVRNSANLLPPIDRRSRHEALAVSTQQPTISSRSHGHRTPSGVTQMQRQRVEQTATTVHNDEMATAVDATVQSTTAPSTKLHSTVDRPASLAPTSQTASGGIITTMPGRRDVPPAPVNSQNNLRLSVLRESFENSEPSVNSRRSTMDEGSDRNNDGDKVTASPRPPARPDSDT